MLETALTMTDSVADPSVSESFASYHAFIRAKDVARCCATRPLAVGHRRAAARLEQGPPGHARRRVPRLRRSRGSVRLRFGQPLRRPDHRLRVRQGLRAAAADEPHRGGDVPARLAAAQGHAVVRRAGRDAARAARVRWAGRRCGLPEAAITESLEAVFNAMGAFAQAYRIRPSSAWTTRWSGGCCRTATWRRCPGERSRSRCWRAGTPAATCPSWTRRTRGVRCSPPTTPLPPPAGWAAHRAAHGGGRLGPRGDPPELWEAAQRLLDAGQDRHLVLHALMAVLDHTSGDEASLIAVLRELEADEPRR